MSKHTPGPWRLIDGAIKGPKNKTIALRTIEDLDNREANARLICAAPLMIDALNIVRSAYLSRPAGEPVSLDRDQMAVILKAIKAALDEDF